MKLIKNTAARLTLVMLLFFVSLFSFAQEKGADINVDINKNGGGSAWYNNPVIWVVGAAVFILLLVALLRGSGSRD